MSRVILETFQSIHEAEIAKSYLESHGIEASIGGYDSVQPEINFSSRVQLIVREMDAKRAAELLKEAGSFELEEDS